MQTATGLTIPKEKLMRIFVVLICSLALVCVAYGAQPEQGKPQKKKQAQTAQHGAPPTGHPTGAGAGGKKTSMGGYQGKKGQGSMGAYRGQTGKKSQTSVETYGGHKGKKGQTSAGAYERQPGKPAKGGKVTGAMAATGKSVKPQHFKLPKEPNIAKAPAV